MSRYYSKELVKMKEYKKVVVEAKNASSGAYAAGCPTKAIYDNAGDPNCRQCESVK